MHRTAEGGGLAVRGPVMDYRLGEGNAEFGQDVADFLRDGGVRFEIIDDQMRSKRGVANLRSLDQAADTNGRPEARRRDVTMS